jgi:hypothetical protein
VAEKVFQATKSIDKVSIDFMAFASLGSVDDRVFQDRIGVRPASLDCVLETSNRHLSRDDLPAPRPVETDLRDRYDR